MNYQLTQHASEVIMEREIQFDWIDRTLDEPELIREDIDDDELQHYFRRIEECGNRVLRVVINKRMNPKRLVTVYFDRTMKGKL